jgi:tetratricopeptide (TPR) repeat protein
MHQGETAARFHGIVAERCSGKGFPMGRMTALWLAAVATAAIAATSGVALASGGGGGGMSMAPSFSAPAYDPAAEYAKGVSALQAKDYREAEHAFRHVTDAVPDGADAWRLLGEARMGQSDWKGARRAYERAVKLTPDDLASHAGLGLALANLKDGKAQGELDWLNAKAQACGGNCPEAASLQAAAAQVQQAMSSAAPVKPSAAIDGALIFAGAPIFAGAKAGDAAYDKAVGLINEHRYDDALAALKTAEAVFGPHPDIITYEGYAWRKKGEYDRAERYYRQALAIAPAHRGATEYYGELKVERGDMAGAKVLLARLDAVCAYGCAEAEELRRWVDLGRDPQHP